MDYTMEAMGFLLPKLFKLKEYKLQMGVKKDFGCILLVLMLLMMVVKKDVNLGVECMSILLLSLVAAWQRTNVRSAASTGTAEQVYGGISSTLAQIGGRKIENLQSNDLACSTSKRLFFTDFDCLTQLSPPLPPPSDLLEVIKPCVTSNTRLFKIDVGNSKQLLHAIELDNEVSEKYVGIDSLKKIYNQSVRSAIIARCLLSFYSLEDERTKKLHNEYKRIIGKFPVYMTCLDLMMNLRTMPENKWVTFLDHLSEKRIIVLEDWNTSLGTSSGYTMYDYGLRVAPDDNKDFYRGECDASFSNIKQTAKIGTIIWRDNQVVSCDVFYDIPCKNSVEAEAIAMYCLLKMGIRYENLQVSSDSQIVIAVLRGVHEITSKDKAKELFMLLRYMRTYFKNLIPRWEPREKMTFVDGLLRGHQTTQTEAVLKNWAPYLNGFPVFNIQPRKRKIILDLAKKRYLMTQFQEGCYYEVEQESQKMKALCHIVAALHPQTVQLVVKNLESRPDIREQCVGFFGTYEVVDTQSFYSVLSFILNSTKHYEFARSTITLVILFDASIARGYPRDKNTFIVLLSTPSERDVVTELKFDILSPESFASFHKYAKTGDIESREEEE